MPWWGITAGCLELRRNGNSQNFIASVGQRERILKRCYIQIYPANFLLCYGKSFHLLIKFVKSRVELCGVLLKEEAEHNLVMKSGTFLHSTLYFKQLTMKILKWYSNRQNSIEFWAKNITVALKIGTEHLISGSSRGYFWQPLIPPEARKECQSFPASHIEPRADCPF